jgi:glycosyltransferase involved in cell wall biosynthesis
MVPVPTLSNADDRQLPLTSVVTPVYNGEAYLEQCIESVLSQTYSNWEYVIGDNASSDRTLEIARSYAASDTRIRIHHWETFEDIVANFNRTLTLIARDSVFCKFVLADDWLYPDCLAQMIDTARRNPSVGIIGGYRLNNTYVDLDGVIPVSTSVVPGREIARSTLLGGPYLFGTESNVMYRADLVRAREPEFFPELRSDDDGFVNFHSDSDVCYALLEEFDFGFVHQILSFTRRHTGSVTSTSALKLSTWAPGYLITLLRHGPRFLERAEFVKRTRTVARRYQLFLIRSVIKGRLFSDRRFRDYHRGAVRRIRRLYADDGLRSWCFAVLALLLGQQ